MLWSSAPGLLSSLRWDYLWVSDSLPTCGRSSGCALKRAKMEATPVIDIVPSTCLPWHDRFTCRRGYVWRIRWHGSCHGSLYCSHLLSLVIPKYTTDTVFLWRLRLFFPWNVGLLWVQIVLGTSEAHQSFSPDSFPTSKAQKTPSKLNQMEHCGSTEGIFIIDAMLKGVLQHHSNWFPLDGATATWSRDGVAHWITTSCSIAAPAHRSIMHACPVRTDYS